MGWDIRKSVFLASTAGALTSPVVARVQANAAQDRGATTAPAAASAIPARQATGPGSAPDQSGRLEEIVVTAQRRETSLQDTPIAVTALTERALRVSGSRFLEDISVAVPGLQLPGRTLYNQFPTSIRGISSIDIGVAFDTPVAVYIDGVYIGRQFATRSALAGVERIEVLRGPQGVTFGRNAAAGAIQIIHKAPLSTPEGSISAGYGSFGTYNLDGSFSGPIAANVNGVLNMGYQSSRGSIYNETLARHVAGDKTFNASGAIDVRPDDQLLIRLRGDYEDSRSTYGGRRLTVGFAGPRVTSLNRSSLEQQQGFPIDHVRNDFATVVNRKTGGTSLEARYDIGGVDLVSLSAVRYSKFDGQVDSDGTSTAFGRNVSSGKHNQFSQEFRASNRGSGPLHWDAGLYYFHERAQSVANITIVPTNTLIFVPGLNRLNSYAAFVNGVYTVADGLELQAGVRYTSEKKHFTQNAVDLRGKWNAWTPKLSINYHVNDDILAYVSASRGFKSGGFNIAPPEAFGTERVWSYEGGLKVDAFDRHLRFNTAVFKEDYDGLQVTVSTGPGTTKTSNADANIKGVEFEATAIPFAGFQISGNLAYLDATYAHYLFSSAPLISYAGKRLPRESKWKGAITAEYGASLGTLGRGTTRLSYSYEGRMPQDDANSPGLIRPVVGLLDARVGLTTLGDRLELAAYGRNLTDKRYISVVQFLFAQPVGFPSENRRSFGVDATYRF